MRAPAHIATAALVGALAFPGQPAPVMLSVLAGLIADVDTPSSLVGKILFFISIPLGSLFGHRTVTHSILGAFATGALLAAFLEGLTRGLPAASVMFPWLLGYATHLLLDSLTTAGVPLLWPYGGRLGLKLESVGGIMELAYTLAMAWLWLSPWGRGMLSNLF